MKDMALDMILLDQFQLTKNLHAVISITFSILSVWLIIRSIRGLIYRRKYTPLDKWLSYGFILTLYLQLIFGLILFARPETSSGEGTIALEGALKMASKRFWPIEHIVLMLFALLIANVGLILSAQSQHDIEKHRKTLIYYAIALVMITISLSAI